jgi:transposase
VRLQAAEWFAEGVTPPEVPRRLRVSCNSAYVWRRRWRAGGLAALTSRGPGGAVCRLSTAQLGRLRAALEAGQVARLFAGWRQELATCRKFAPAARNYAAARLMADVGLRVNEARCLDWPM